MDTTPLIENDSIDALIAQRLPEWMKNGSPDRLAALHRALVQQQRNQQRLQQVLDDVKSLESFAAPLLTDALQQATGLTLDVQQAQFKLVWHVIKPPVVTSLPPRATIHSSQQSLLATALHNFSGEEEEAGAFTAQSGLYDASDASLPIEPEAFARICRTLDLGGQYQAYLKARFTPQGEALGSAGKSREALEALLEASPRLSLAAAVRLAELKGDIDQRTYLQMLPVISARPVVPADVAILQPRQLYLLGKCINAVVVLEVRQGTGFDAAVEGVVAWIPGDPHGEVSRHASWAALYQALGLRMRQPGYPGFFQRFISERDRVDFSRVLAGLLAAGEPVTPIELDGRNFELEERLYVHLRKARIDKIFDDARVLAISTDEENRADRTERLRGYRDAGLDLLNLAALFVPGLGLAMLGLLAAQAVEGLYEGYEDWQLGDREGALGHLFGVVENVAATAALVAGVAVGGKLLTRVDFVDDLLPIRTSSGQTRLFAGDLSGYRLPEGASAAARVPKPGQPLRLHEGTFKVTQNGDGGTWRIQHPRREQAYSPRLQHNGGGGWRCALEQPHQWQGKALLLRRLGPEMADVSEPVAQAILDATGFDEEALRRLHLENAPAPARLLDALERQRLHERFPEESIQAIDQRIAQAQGAPLALERPLLRDFPGLTVRGAREIIGQASSLQRQAMLDSGRVPLALAEQARWYLRDSRLDRACAGLRQPSAVNKDTEKLALGLIQEHAPWPRNVRIELRDDDINGALRAEAGRAGATELGVIVRNVAGYTAIGTTAPTPVTSGLLEALLQHLDEGQLQALGEGNGSTEHLRDWLALQASSRRESAARMIGQSPVGLGLKPPTRLGDGRIGYPLSGRGTGSRRALKRAITQLYPTFTESQLQAYISERLGQGVELWGHIANLQQQLESLESGLQLWQRENVSAPISASRSRVAQRILRCWRRQTAQLAGNDYRLLIDGERFGNLPVLPIGIDFSHVRHLTLRGAGLTSIDQAFLQRFTGVRQLDLGANQLQALPASIEQMSALEELDLSDNHIVIEAEGSTRLGALSRLRALNLSRNPLGTDLDLGPLLRLNRVYLRGCGLTALPPGILRQAGLEFVDLRNNQISGLDEALFALPAHRLRRIVLHDNPLPADVLNRLEDVGQAGASGAGGSRQHASVDEAARNRWLEHVDATERAQRQMQWDSLAQEQGARDFFQLLADLRGTEDFTTQPVDLTRRVWLVIDGCEQSSELRQVIFELASGPRSCSDSVALNFSLLEVRAWVLQRISGLSGHDAERAMLRLGRSLFRLDEVDRFAALDIQRRQQRGMVFDEVEVRLAYRTGLAKPLGLPGQPQSMRFAQGAGVTSRQLLSVRSDVLSSEQTPRLIESLAGREFWQEHLRSEYAQRFEQVDRPFYARLEALSEQQPKVTDQVYLQQVDTVAAEREAAQQRLIDQLTEKAYQRSPW